MNNDFVCAENYKPLIPEGNYEVQCIKYDSSFIAKRRKTFLHFRILEPGSYCGKTIFMAFNMPDKGKIRMGSKYYKTWCMVNDWKKPSKNTKMSPRIFKNKIFKVKVRTVYPKHDGKKMPEDYWYSVVDKIIEVVAG